MPCSFIMLIHPLNPKLSVRDSFYNAPSQALNGNDPLKCLQLMLSVDINYGLTTSICSSAPTGYYLESSGSSPSVDMTPNLPSQSSSTVEPFGWSMWRSGRIIVALYHLH